MLKTYEPYKSVSVFFLTSLTSPQVVDILKEMQIPQNVRKHNRTGTWKVATERAVRLMLSIAQTDS